MLALDIMHRSHTPGQSSSHHAWGGTSSNDSRHGMGGMGGGGGYGAQSQLAAMQAQTQSSAAAAAQGLLASLGEQQLPFTAAQ